MKIIFRINIDHYQTDCFPDNLEQVPRIGETVHVTDSFIPYYSKQRLPTRMKVVDVVWTEHGAVCELWYTERDTRAAELSGVKLL